MGIFDKIKNALFEEEYVEVEEKPKTKPKKEKLKRPQKEVPKEKPKENKPIAKKVILPEKKEERVNRIEEEDLVNDDFEASQPELPKHEEKNEFKFPMMEDKDFNDLEDTYQRSEPEIVKVIESDSFKEEKESDDNSYRGKREKPLYGIDEASQIPVHEYGAYEKKDERGYFKPSPIISPIYGILDKNYKKEEIVTKREVRLTSSYARENLSVDDVRRKAFGTLSDDIARGVHEETEKEDYKTNYDDTDDSNLLVDLSNDSEKPQVHEVTMGDAEEYFQDLGLEYNIDYKDATKEVATGRRVKEKYEEEIPEEKEIENEPVPSKEDTNMDVETDDNLFDLIDSMYEEDK